MCLHPDFWGRPGWFGNFYAMTSGAALSICCRASPGTQDKLARIIADLLRRFCGLLGREVLGAICPMNWAIGTRRTRVLHAGAGPVFGHAWPRPLAVTQIWSNYSLIQPSYALTSMPPGPKKNWAARARPVPGRVEYQDPRSSRCTGQSVAVVAQRRASGRYHAGNRPDPRHRSFRGHRRQGLRLRCLGADHSGRRCLGGHSASLQSKTTQAFRCSHVQRSQSGRALLQPLKAIPANCQSLREACPELSFHPQSRVRLHLARVIVNTP